MDRTLVTQLSSLQLALVMIAVFLIPAMLGIFAIRRWAPGLAGHLSNEVTGVVLTVMAAVYGVMLAFGVVVLYEQYRDAQQHVHAESGALSNVYRSSEQLPEPTAGQMAKLASFYAHDVAGHEWDEMADGKDSPAAWAAVDEMYTVLGSTPPLKAADRPFHNQAVVALAALVDARRARVDDAQATLPTPFLVLLIGGGFLLLFFNLLFDVKDRRYHIVVVAATGVLLGFSLMLAMSLQYPFSGSIAVSSEPFHEGTLADLPPCHPEEDVRGYGCAQ